MTSFPFIFFMHIPKTAGMSFITMMEKLVGAQCVLSFAEQFMADANVLRRNVADKQLVTGHIFFHDWKHQMAGGRPYRAVTLIREPIRQIVSHIRWIDHYNDPEFEEEYRALDPSTARLVDRLRIVDFGDPGSVDFFLTHLPPIGVRYLDNCQCRYFLRPDLLQPWEPMALNVTNELLIAMNEFALIGLTDYLNKFVEALVGKDNIGDMNFDSVENKNKHSRNIDYENDLIRDVLKKRVLVDEWLAREIQYRWRVGFYPTRLDKTGER
jgi:hypothetical protein